MPSAGYLWDAAKRKGQTYRSYGEYAGRASTGEPMSSIPGATGLIGHVSPNYLQNRVRDTDNAKVFLDEFSAYEANYDSADPEKRLPSGSPTASTGRRPPSSSWRTTPRTGLTTWMRGARPAW